MTNAQPTSNAFPHPHGVAVADFTGDGQPDVIVDSWGNNRVALIEGDGTGQLAGTRQMFTVGRRPYERLRSADFNRDGHPDIVTTNLDDGTVTILLGDGKGGFREAEGSPFAAGAAPWAVAVGDVNDDENVDFVVIPYERDVHDRAKIAATILLGDGAGRFRSGRMLALDGCTGANGVAIGDIDGDRRQDIVVSCATSATLAVFRAQADGSYARSSRSIGPGPTWGGVAVADLDGDGAGDIVASNAREGVIRIFFGACATNAASACPCSRQCLVRSAWLLVRPWSLVLGPRRVAHQGQKNPERTKNHGPRPVSSMEFELAPETDYRSCESVL